MALSGRRLDMVQRVLRIYLVLTLSMMSAEGRGYSEVTKLGSSSHTTYYSLDTKSVAMTELHKRANHK